MAETWQRKTRTVLRALLPFPSRNRLRRWFPKFEERNIAHLFAEAGIGTILDVGAHTGQFVTKMRSCGFKGQIISFEPVAQFHKTLRDKSRNDPNWVIAEQMGLGDQPGELTIKVMGTHSSFKEMINSLDYRSEIVPVATLDSVIDRFGIDPTTRLALKLDVQGYEKEVLEGGLKTLEHVHAMLIELSMKPVYHGEVHYLDMLSYLREKGFHVVYFSPVVNRARLGVMWQVDALLIRQPT
jgi:FkbM family methyltransferase